MELKSAIFDMDGVITDTAQVHFKAWKQILDDYLEEEAEKRKTIFQPFTLEDYIRYVDGLSRIDGIKYFLQSRNLISMEEGALNEEERKTVNHIAEIKNKVFLELIEKEGVNVFSGTIDLIRELKNNHIKTAVISSSKNCEDILTRAEVINLFDAVVDGKALYEFNLKGKPDPAIFLEAAKRIKTNPWESIVIEDALSGIIAGKAGRFGLVIGIDRQKKWAEEFRQQGADIVVNDLSEIKLNQIRAQLTEPSLTYAEEITKITSSLENKKVILFFDYDGTLTPIVPTPDQAILSDEMKSLLSQMKDYCSVIILSGRELKNLSAKVGIQGLYYGGNHGFEITGPEYFGRKFEKGAEFLPIIAEAYQDLTRELSAINNCLIENKKFSLSVHYRLVHDNDLPRIKRTVNRIAGRYPVLRAHEGKKVFELRPRIQWNKGKALKFILKEINANHNDVVLYVGDDVTDEDAFKALNKEGIGILVSESPRKTHAKYRLPHPGAVGELLKDILRVLIRNKFERKDKSWILEYQSYNPSEEKLRETLCTLGNGYFATRGAAEESQADAFHSPGAYFAGVYNRLRSLINGHEIYNEDLVNMPNWLRINFKIISDTNEKTTWLSLSDVTILDYQQSLNLKRATLTRKIRIRDKQGRVTRLKFKRFISMANPHIAAQKFIIKAENWSGKVLIQSGLDGSVTNSNVLRYRELNDKHLEPLKLRASKKGNLMLLMRTNQSHIEVAYAAFHHHHPKKLLTYAKKNKETVDCYFECPVKENHPITLEKIISVATNKDIASSECLIDAIHLMDYIKKEKFDNLLEPHIKAWKHLWKICDIKIDGDPEIQKILRFNIFHLLQTVSKNSVDLDIGAPARGLHGESYRGHIFWDEIFILPFYTFYFPKMARSLLLYRYRRLPMARYLAKKSHSQGAMYPWQSASSGDEVTQEIHLIPQSNQWVEDLSHYQRHINGAIVYNIWRYYIATHDIDFLSDYGAEMILEIAKFWSSIATYNPLSQRYEIKHVVGPDEYHEKYPDIPEPGVNNNAYTNVMAVFSLERALDILALLNPSRITELKESLNLTEELFDRWKDITKKMFIPFHGDGIISQFEGYETLREFDWEKYRKKYENIERLDRILKSENDTPDNYQVSKQADVLMLFYLFSENELGELFSRLGYYLDKNLIKKNIGYYLARTSHGSTLSKVVLASLTEYVSSDITFEYYKEVLKSDIMDIQGGTTPEGIHLGSMASSVMINLIGFAGLNIKADVLSFEPRLPRFITKLEFNLNFRQQWLHVIIDQKDITITLDKENSLPLSVLINGKLELILPQENCLRQ